LLGVTVAALRKRPTKIRDSAASRKRQLADCSASARVRVCQVAPCQLVSRLRVLCPKVPARVECVRPRRSKEHFNLLARRGGSWLFSCWSLKRSAVSLSPPTQRSECTSRQTKENIPERLFHAEYSAPQVRSVSSGRTVAFVRALPSRRSLEVRFLFVCCPRSPIECMHEPRHTLFVCHARGVAEGGFGMHAPRFFFFFF
jgi:hypothetical protein